MPSMGLRVEKNANNNINSNSTTSIVVFWEHEARPWIAYDMDSVESNTKKVRPKSDYA